jgi:hypothetical protein
VIALGVGSLALALLIALIALVQEDADPPQCPVSHTGSVDLVPSGVRPCVLYGRGAAPGPDYGMPAGTGTGSVSRPGSGRKQTAGPRPAAKPPVVKHPAAPKPAPPVRPAAPLVKR